MHVQRDCFCSLNLLFCVVLVAVAVITKFLISRINPELNMPLSFSTVARPLIFNSSSPVASSNGPWDSDSFLTSSLNSPPPAFSRADPGK